MCLLFWAVDVIFMNGPSQDVLNMVAWCWGDSRAHDGSWEDKQKGLETIITRLVNTEPAYMYNSSFCYLFSRFHHDNLRSCTLLYLVELVISDGEKKAVRSNWNS